MSIRNGVFLLLGVHFCSAAVINYSFEVHRVISNPDGYPRSIVAIINSTTKIGDPPGQRFLPGPTIRARKGDFVRITVHNKLFSETTGIHWHGLHMKNNNWMDGAVGITQPAIVPMSEMTYQFSLTQSGTFWYHSHSHVQYNDGLVGAFIVDEAPFETDPVKKTFTYVEDHVIMLQEWFHERTEDIFHGYKGPYGSYRHSNGNRFMPFPPRPASSLLMNGRGHFDCKFNNSEVNFFPQDCRAPNPSIIQRESFFGPCDTGASPLESFSCPAGKSVRIRLIHSGVSVPIQFWIDKHRLTVVARDAIDVVPLEYDSVTLIVSERIDVIVRCNQQPNSNYYIYAREYRSTPVKWSSAILRYSSSVSSPIATPTLTPESAPFLPLQRRNFELSLKPLKPRFAPPASRRLVVQFQDLPTIRNGPPFEDIIVNNISFVMPMKPMLQEVYLGKRIETTLGHEQPGPYGHHRMTNVIKLPFNEVVEIVLVSFDAVRGHPWHLHGYTMDVIAVGNLNPTTDFNTQGATTQCGDPLAGWVKDEAINRVAPPLGKAMPVLSAADIFFVEGASYTIFRLKLDNPGLWMFHCHINWHLENGMALVFSVERNGKYPGLRPPPKGFPVQTEW